MRRWSGEWASAPATGDVELDVLVPTVGRAAELAVTLAGLAAQEHPSFRVVVADQSEQGVEAEPAVRAMIAVLRAEGRPVVVLPRSERRGVAEQRQFLLEQATAPYALFLDDDVWLEPGAVARMHDAIRRLRCGFVGQAVQGLSYLGDERVHEREALEFWGDAVAPERVRRGTDAFERWPLHNAANLAHAARDAGVPRGGWRAYRVAWVGACVLYDRAALAASGGFDFWRDLPSGHAGEDVAAQWRVMERYGGAGILPSGAVHLESPTSVLDRRVEAIDVVFADPASDGTTPVRSAT